MPYLDTQCRFPWRGVAGCKDKDAHAMLELTTSYAIKLQARLAGVPAWYGSVRRNYGAR
ncbi:hypothetical protein [Bradyrhizobium sp. JR3.5]